MKTLLTTLIAILGLCINSSGQTAGGYVPVGGFDTDTALIEGGLKVNKKIKTMAYAGDSVLILVNKFGKWDTIPLRTLAKKQIVDSVLAGIAEQITGKEDVANKTHDTALSGNANNYSDVPSLRAYVYNRVKNKQEFTDTNRVTGYDATKFYVDSLYYTNKARIDSLVGSGFAVTTGMFGAVPNDNNDDAVAFQAAIDYAAANKKVKVIAYPAGEFKWIARDSVRMKGNLSYEFWGSTFRQTEDSTAIFYTNQINDIDIHGGTFIGKGTDYNHTNNYDPKPRPSFLYVLYSPGGASYDTSIKSNNIHIDGIFVKNFAHSQLYIHTSTNVWVSNSRFVGAPAQLGYQDNWNFGVNISNGVKGLYLENLSIDSCAVPIMIQTNVRDGFIKNCSIKEVLGQHAIYAGNQQRFVIENNNIWNTTLSGILIQAVASPFDPGAPGNIIIRNNRGYGIGTHGIIAYNLSSPYVLNNIEISGNSFFSRDTTSIRGAGISARSIRGLKIYDNELYGFATGIDLLNDTVVNCYDNTVKGSKESGIIASTVVDGTFTNNRVYESAISNVANNQYSLFITGTSAGLTFTGNHIRDSSGNADTAVRIAPTVDQASLSFVLNTIDTGAVLFQADQNIRDYFGNLTNGLANEPLSVLKRRLSVGVVGNTPNTSGLSLSFSGVFTLQPASASFPGVVTIGTQSFAGNKTWFNSMDFISATYHGGIAHFLSSLQVLNKAGNGYIPFFTRNTTGSQTVYDGENLGAMTITATPEPANPAAGTVVEWWDGTNKKWKKSDGSTGIIY